MTNIQHVIKSINTMHGGDREQVSKHASFVAWQLRQRAERSGNEPSPVLKSIEA